jgi:hypothetical protein
MKPEAERGLSESQISAAADDDGGDEKADASQDPHGIRVGVRTFKRQQRTHSYFDHWCDYRADEQITHWIFRLLCSIPGPQSSEVLMRTADEAGAKISPVCVSVMHL